MAENEDLTPEQLAALRPPPKPTPSEAEAYQGRIKELEEENERLKTEIAELKKPAPLPPKKKSILERFAP
jgi:cell division protein FtsB